MTADLSSAEPGDIAIVALPIEKISDGRFLLPFTVDGVWSRWFLASEIRAIEKAPKPLKVGDRVTHVAYGWEASIIGIDGEWAWLRFRDSPSSYRLADLRRAPSNKIG